MGKYHGLAKNDALGTNNHKDISAFTTTIQAKLLPTKAFKMVTKWQSLIFKTFLSKAEFAEEGTFFREQISFPGNFC